MRACLIVLLFVVSATGCEPVYTTWDARESFPVFVKAGAASPAAPAPLALKVMTWNVKYGAGRIDFWFDLWGDRTEMTLPEVEGNMAGIYALINDVQPDVLLTNEIEIDSKRSAYYDMVKGILDHTALQWAAYTPTWQSRFVPSEGVGRMNMGNCIFSRYPIVASERIAQADRTDQDPVTSAFYLHRAVGRAELEVGGRHVAVYTVHTEAYDQDRTNARQQAQILELVRAETLPFLLGGDLNALPPGTVKVADFNDEAPAALGTAFAQPPYHTDDLLPFYGELREAIDLARYGTTEAEQQRFYTHSVIGEGTIGANGEPGFWNRHLDYLFVRPPDAWRPGSTDVLQRRFDSGIQEEPIGLSDHCPVIGTWDVAAVAP